jgi:hypothetical protein
MRRLEAITILLLLFASGWIVFRLYGRVQPLGIDFAPVWAASPPIAYDPFAVTKAHPFQVNLLRPFAYPPTALLLFTPFRLLPFELSYPVFAAGGFLFLVWAALRAGSAWWVMISAPVLLLVQVGQPSLWVGGLILAGLSSKDWQLKGLAFGFAVALKPQLCVFLPLLLAFRRDWRSLVTTAATIAILVGIATLTYGASIWSDWIGATHVLVSTVKSNRFLADDIVGGSPVIMSIPATALVWVTRSAEARIQLAAIVGAALLVSPYAMSYELALLAPALACTRAPLFLIASVGLAFGFYLAPTVTLVCALLVVCVTYARRKQAPAGVRTAVVQPGS